MSTQRIEIVNEIDAIRTRASDLHAKLMNSKDASECAGLSQRLAELHERHAALMEQLQRIDRTAAA